MENFKLPKIGLRQIKTAFSVLVCLILFFLLDRNPIYACIAAIVCMQTTMETSISTGVDRLIGTAIGGIIGLIFIMSKQLFFNIWVYFALIAIGIIVVIYSNLLLKKTGSVAISCVVFLIIMINAEIIASETAINSMLYAVNRVLDTGVGVIVGVGVNLIINNPRKKKKPIKIACVGSSTTEGIGAEPISEMSYPAQLQTLLKKKYRNKYEVQNFGLGGTCMITDSSIFSYSSTEQYAASKEYCPDIVTIALGSNDAVELHRFEKPFETFYANCLSLVSEYMLLPSKPKIYLVLPQATFPPENPIREQNVNEIIIPALRKTADVLMLDLIDMHKETLNHPEWSSDGLHPNNKGYSVIADLFYLHIT